MLKISIEDEFLDIAEAFSALDHKELMAASYRAINRTMLKVRMQSIERIREHLNIKSTVLKDEYIKMLKAKGGSLLTVNGELTYSGRPTALLHFVKGNKDVIEQKGIPVNKRRKLRFEVKPGKTFKLKSAFIQQVHSKQVFIRKRGGGFNTLSVASIASVLIRHKILEELVFDGRAILLEEMQRDLNYRILKMQGKIQNGSKVK